MILLYKILYLISPADVVQVHTPAQRVFYSKKISEAFSKAVGDTLFELSETLFVLVIITLNRGLPSVKSDSDCAAL